jgi:hypothetical protein
MAFDAFVVRFFERFSQERYNPIRHHATKNMAEVVEHELMENVSSLKCYIQDTTELLRKLNKIPKLLPGNYIMLCLDVKALFPSFPRMKARITCEKALQKHHKPSILT